MSGSSITRVAQIECAFSSSVRFEELTPAPADADVRFAFRSEPLIRDRFTLGTGEYF